MPSNITGRDVYQRVEFDKTVLHIATDRDLLEAAKWLINEGADLGAKDTLGWTPLHYVAYGVWDNVDAARLLISHGAKVDAKNGQGSTPLHAAASRNKLKVAQLLIDNGADKNIKAIGGQYEGKKPIDVARHRGH